MKPVLVALLMWWGYPMYAQTANSGTAYTEISAIPYYQGADQDTANHKLNLILPKNVTKPPLLIWIGGGAWSYVNRNMEMDVARKMAAKGFAVASVSHRLSAATWKDPALNTGIKHPEHIKDIARAIKYLHANAATYGYSDRNIFVGGYSSGGHLAALIVMDGQYLASEGLSKSLIRGVIPMAGTYDIGHYHQVLTSGNGLAFADNHIGSVFGLTPKEFELGSPSSYIDGLATPMLLVSETNTFKYTRLFEDKLREANYSALEVVHVHRLNHGELWKNLSYAPESIYRDLMADFIKRNSETL
ncbi:alpha/beta hydrolase [Telluribacter sp.]|uniref:alpha/beta hydrolase n=1 Tax=Telluribacter sp. TaxID=1978767 RepID=UPI002E13B647|nr:alpha/beta hydrolase [Telluribacter sp.]